MLSTLSVSTSDLSAVDNVQMLSHGSADLILEACTDFWDGTDIYPLSGSDRCSKVKRLTVFTSTPRDHLSHCLPLPLQEEGSGFLPARLSVRLLLSICIQTHAGIIVHPAEWEVCGAGPRSLPLLWSGSALHHPHQTQLLQEQLEL